MVSAEGLRQELAAAFAWRRDEVGTLSDMSGIYARPDLLGRLGTALADLHRDSRPEAVVCLQSQGWLLGPLVAVELGVGVVQIHKNTRGGNLADGMYIRNTPPDYKNRTVTMSMRRSKIRQDQRVLVVDDWVETGAQAEGAANLIEDANAEFVGVASIVDASSSGTRRRLNVRSLLRVEELGNY